MNKKVVVGITGVLLVALFVAAAVIYNQKKADEISSRARKKASYLERDYSPTLGSPDAKVTIVEFYDPACETCRAFHPFVKQMMAAHPGKIRLVHRYTPFHQGADVVVKMLEAARLQNRYWDALEITFESQPSWAAHHNPQPERLWMYLGKLNLDMKKMNADMASPEIASRIRQDMADARQLQAVSYTHLTLPTNREV